MPNLDLLTELTAAAAVVAVVWLFVRYLQSLDARTERLAKECHEVQKGCVEIIGKCRETIGETTAALRESIEATREIKVLLKRMNGA